MVVLDLQALAAQLAEQVGDCPRLVVTIDGLGGAGKSTLAAALATELGAAVVQGDDFYRTSAERSAPDFDPAEIGGSFDWVRLREQVLRSSSQGSAVRYQRYDWDHDRLGAWVELDEAQPLIVEGVYVARPELRGFATTTMWVETERSSRLERGLERDGEEARSLWVDEWMPAEDRYVLALDPAAACDIIIDGSGSVEHDPTTHVVVTRRRALDPDGSA